MQEENSLNSNWRKVATSIYKKPVDSKIFGSVEIDITDLENYITEKRKLGIKITLTHFFVLTIARALKYEVPELNAFVRRGIVVARKSIDASVSVLLKGGQMGSVVLKNADQLTLPEAVEEMSRLVTDLRKGGESKTMKNKSALSNIPWPFRGWIFRLIKLVTIDWGISLPSIGLAEDNFGSFVVSNIGSLGLDMGYPALLPISNVSFVLILGGVNLKPAVAGGQIVPRRILSLGVALDHRVVDASHGGTLFRFIKHIVKNPVLLESKPE